MYALLSSEVPHLVRDLALVLGVAAITSVLFQKWRQPLVLGYLLAGAILGPNIPVPLHVYDETVLRDLSELGVTLVVFCIGLEFSLSRIGTMGAGALIATSVEMGLQLLLGVLFGIAMFVGCFALYAWGIDSGLGENMARTLAFVALTVGNLMLVRVIASTPPFEAVYEICEVAAAIVATNDAVFTIDPLPWRCM